jgi:hypothetical protein
MAITKTTITDKIEIVGVYKHIQIRKADVISEDGVELTRSFSRYVLTPGQDISNESEEVQSIASVIWTEDIVAQYEASQQNGL